MLKFLFKTALVAALVGGVAVAFVGPDRVEHWVHASKSAVEEKISEFQGMTSELRKIDARVDRLDSEIADLKENVLKEEFEIQNLDKEIQGREEGLQYLRNNLEKADELLLAEDAFFTIRGIHYTRNEIEQDVAEKMRLYQVQEDTLAQLRMTRQTRQAALDMAHENVARGQAVREDLIGKVRLMQAKLERYKARQFYAEAVASDFDAREFNTEIGEARQSLSRFEQKLEVKSRLLDEQMRVAANEDGVVSGIDYTKTAEVELSLHEQLSTLLSGSAQEQTGSVAHRR